MSDSKRSSSGGAFVLLGVGMWVVWLILFGLESLPDSPRLIGRISTYLVVALPVGLVAIIIGVVKIFRNRRS